MEKKKRTGKDAKQEVDQIKKPLTLDERISIFEQERFQARDIMIKAEGALIALRQIKG